MSIARVLTSESVTGGHPDKVCDYIADSILDAYIEQDPLSRVACEVMCKGSQVVLAGEITSNASVDHELVVRTAIREIGYTIPDEQFNADTVEIKELLTTQASEIARAVNPTTNPVQEQGAGDQGIMWGYATDETPELMPLPILLAHRVSRGLAEDREGGRVPWLRPDGKTQVSVAYEDGVPIAVTDVVVSTQHSGEVMRGDVEAYVRETLLPRALGRWYNDALRVIVNPSGSFVEGGPSADCGVTGRKIMVDTYGGAARHGGGAFSGKDPSKVDRSVAYFCRYVARQVVKKGLARRVEIQVAYAIGVPQPVSIWTDCFGTGDEKAVTGFVQSFDFRPAAIIEKLDLLKPIYRQTTNYGHFGRPGMSWEDL